jgi:hypothetical protein
LIGGNVHGHGDRQCLRTAILHPGAGAPGTTVQKKCGKF